jgi:DnaK suppressor protein
MEELMPVKSKKTTTQKKNTQSKKPLKKAKPVKGVIAKKKAAVKKPAKKLIKKPAAKQVTSPKKAIAKSTPVKKKKTMPTKAVKKIKAMTNKGTTTKKPVIKKAQPKASKIVEKIAPKKISKAVKSTDRSLQKPSTKQSLPQTSAVKAKAAASLPAKAQEASLPLPEKVAIPQKPLATKKANSPSQAAPSTKRPGVGPAGFSPYEPTKGEEYMNEVQSAHFQHVLNLWKEQLYADRNATTQHMRDDTVNFPDPLDRAALEEEHTLEWRAREREHRLIAKIEQALANIKQGDYGYCEGCGAEIGIRRLEARPTATQCIDCKTINEIREKHIGTVE